MDGLVGALHVDAAELAHQQAGDERRYDVGHGIRHHQHYHDREGNQGVDGLAASRRHLVHLGGQAEQQEVPVVGLQLANEAPVAHHQQAVPHQQRLIHQLAGERLTVAADPDHAQAVAGTKRHLADALAEQAGFGNEGDLGHTHLPRLIREILSAQYHGLEPRLGAKLPHIHLGVGHVDEQYVLGLELGDAGDGHHHPSKLAPALQPDDVGPEAGTQLQLVQGLAYQGESGRIARRRARPARR